MAIAAERLQLAHPELVPDALMRLDVVGDHASHHKPLLKATLAQRMAAHLKFLLRLPATETIPVARIAAPVCGHRFFFLNWSSPEQAQTLERGDTQGKTEISGKGKIAVRFGLFWRLLQARLGKLRNFE